MSVASPPPRLLARGCAALALGVLVGPYSTGHRQTMGVVIAVAAILALAVAGGALVDGTIRHKLVGVMLAEIALCGLGAGLAALIVWLVGWTRGAPDLLVTLAVALAPAAAGFALSRATGKEGELFKTATLNGVLSWLGILAHFIAYWTVQAQARASQTAAPANTPSGHLGPGGLGVVGFVLTIVGIFFTVGFVYAAGAGLLGAGGRRALARLLG